MVVVKEVDSDQSWEKIPEDTDSNTSNGELVAEPQPIAENEVSFIVHYVKKRVL